MRKRRLVYGMAFLILSGGLLFFYRLELINLLQHKILTGIGKAAVTNNRNFAPLAATGVSQHPHEIYTLSGTGRIWPHRVNSLSRFHYLYHQFAGFESDIRFNATARILYVAHDPDEIKSLTFSDYLKADPDHKLFWLDLKNLGDSNIHSFCEALLELDARYAIKNRIILESSDTTALSALADLGYLTSYYLPPVNVSDSAACRNYVDAIKSFLKSHPSFISQDAGMHDFMSRHFSSQKQLLWDIHFWTSMNHQRLLKYSNDTSLLICLINIKSPGYL